jgi:hypothetical protein
MIILVVLAIVAFPFVLAATRKNKRPDKDDAIISRIFK